MIDRTSNTILTSRANAQAVQIAEGLRFASLQALLDQMRVPGSTPDDVRQHFIDLLTEKADGQLRSAADNLASEALSLGRLNEATVFKDDIETATYTSLLDENTCDPCSEADGTETEMGSAEYERLSPPYQDCEGGNRCRCQFVFTLKTEAPSGPVPLSPLAPSRPFPPLPGSGFFPPPLPTPETPFPPRAAAPTPAPQPVATPPARPVEPPVPLPVEAPVAAPVAIPALPLTGTPQEFATALTQRALATDPAVRPLLGQISSADGGTMFGLNFRIKGITFDDAGNIVNRTDSLVGKITRDVPGLTGAEVEKEIRDSLRYTTLYNDATYSGSTERAIASLKARGYTMVRQTNYWTSATETSGYQGINTVWRAPNGQVFEWQFHTPTSIDAKEKFSHPLYDKLKNETDPKRMKVLKDEIARIWHDVPRPSGVLDLTMPKPAAPVVARPERIKPAPVKADDHKLPKAARVAVEAFEDAHRGDKVESAVFISPKGKTVLTKLGTKSRVHFTNDEFELARGAVGAHNHPGGTAPSPTDYAFLRASGLLEMRVARNGDGTTTVRLTDKGRAATESYFRGVVNGADKATQAEIWQEIATKRITPEEANKVHGDRVAARLVQLGYVTIRAI